jgi:eukaryotic-like serine/threonine-protein kinase
MLTRRLFIKRSLGGAALLFLAGPRIYGTEDEIWFAHISDPHNGNPEAADGLRFVLRDILHNFPDIRFVAVTGDITEHGWEEELAENYEVMEEAGLTYYNVMGNHDSRWSRTGRKAFRDTYGGTRWAVHTRFASVYLIDSSVLLEQYGYLDPFELSWLENELIKINGKPAIIGFHHPPCYPAQYIGSENRFFRIISEHNVPLILAGHVHSLNENIVNGTHIITGGSTRPPERGYNLFRMNEEVITYFTRNPVTKTTDERGRIAYGKNERYAPDRNEIDLLDIKRDNGVVRISSPERWKSNGTVVRLNGVLTDSIRTNGSISLRENLRPGEHEIMLVTPDETARSQERMWGKVSIPAPPGRVRWISKLPAGIQCRPVFTSASIVTGCNNGVLYALDRENGSVLWEKKLSENELLSSPVLHNESLYIGSIDREILSLDPGSGEIRWKTSVDGSVIATAMFTGNALIAGTGSGTLYALDPGSGKTLWTFDTDNLIKATPAFDGKRLLFGSWDGYFYCLDAETGALLWKKYINIPHFAPATSNPKIDDGRVYFVSHDYRTHCLDVETGDVVWQFPAADVEFDYRSPIIDRCKPSYSSAVFRGDAVYFCSLTGHVVGFDTHTGEQVFEYELDAPVFDSFPILLGETMYFGTIRGAVCALDLAAGTMTWSYSFGYEYIFSPPEADGSELAIGSLGGSLGLFGI